MQHLPHDVKNNPKIFITFCFENYKTYTWIPVLQHEAYQFMVKQSKLKEAEEEANLAAAVAVAAESQLEEEEEAKPTTPKTPTQTIKFKFNKEKLKLIKAEKEKKRLAEQKLERKGILPFLTIIPFM